MRQQMNLVQRRASGTHIGPEVTAKQDALHLITLQRLALLIDAGMKLKYMLPRPGGGSQGRESGGRPPHPQARGPCSQRSSPTAKEQGCTCSPIQKLRA